VTRLEAGRGLPADTRTRTVPILAYHSLSRHSSAPFRRFVLDPALFEDHLAFLASQGWRTSTVGELAARRAGGGSIPDRTVVITFDDGFADFHAHALPALERHRMTATLFVITGYVGGTSEWMRPDGEGDRPILSWEQLDDVVRYGIECASHTHTHPQLDVLPALRVRAELTRSRRLLEDRLAVPVESFAYPYGYHSAAVRAAVAEAGYRSACAVADQMSGDDDRFALPRLTVTAGTDPDGLAALLDQDRPGTGQRQVGRAKQLVWRGVRRHGPRSLVGRSASGMPLWASRMPLWASGGRR
jgi:peptidoglycan/xylan/chitin deacetylase (PgdA/CDA1 family)